MISQPINGFTDEQIVETRNRFLEYAKKENLEVVNTYFSDEWYSNESMSSRGVVQIPLCFLAKSLEISDKPTIVIAKTTKGKGVSFMENSVLWHYRPPDQSELNNALEEVRKEK